MCAIASEFGGGEYADRTSRSRLLLTLIVVARVFRANLMHGVRGEPRGNSLFAYLSRANKRSRSRSRSRPQVSTFVAQTIRTRSRHVSAFPHPPPPGQRDSILYPSRDDSRYRPVRRDVRTPWTTRIIASTRRRANNKSHGDYATGPPSRNVISSFVRGATREIRATPFLSFPFSLASRVRVVREFSRSVFSLRTTCNLSFFFAAPRYRALARNKRNSIALIEDFVGVLPAN